jgi:hypothetical protein
MTTCLRPIAGLVAVGMLCVTAAAQEPGLDAATPPPAPDSVVSGTVRDALTARPIARALVAIVHAGGTIERTAITDDEGRFAFEGAPAGRFTLFATKVPYVWPRWTLGQPASAVVLPGGDRRQNVELRLQRGSAIAGTVADSYGRPLPGARVAAMRCTGLEDSRGQRAVPRRPHRFGVASRAVVSPVVRV